MEALERLQLGGDARGEGADGDVTDVAQEVLDADFLGFFGFDDGGGVDEGFGGGGAVLKKKYCFISKAVFQVTFERGRCRTSLISSTAK